MTSKHGNDPGGVRAREKGRVTRIHSTERDGEEKSRTNPQISLG